MLLTPPQGLLARTRWLFLLFALCGTAILGPLLVLIAPSAWPLKGAAVAGLVVVAWRWIRAYRQGHLSPAGDVFEGLALLLFGVTVSYPVGVVVPGVMGQCFRALYGSWRRVAFGTLVYCGAFLGALTLSPRSALLDVSPGQAAVIVGLLAVPAGVMHLVATVLAEHEQALAREQGLRRELEETIQALARAGQAKSEFLATMSHELRTPLHAILGFAELLRDDLPETPGGEYRREYMQRIYESGEHLLGLVNDILDLAQVEAGRLELRPAWFEVRTSLATVEATIRPLADHKALTLAMDVAPEVTRLYADEGRFKQVMYNLLSNAVKFTPAAGRVETSARLADGTLEIVVADTGIGIAPADQERIFDRFQQVDSSTSRRQQGTGLGLALTRQLVELQGGSIWVESALGQGSRFHVTLPVGTPAGGRTRKPTPGPELESEAGQGYETPAARDT
jgi:signal transduction histidine kinase